ncbi:MAG: STAS domain-containing protein [Victivallales bacterium]|nr:STAS domain-containing protein [Victivallales bacterium]
MKNSNITVSRNNNGYVIKVTGRATFDCSAPLRNFAENIVAGSVEKIYVDLSECLWMDSTFMGTLSMLGLNAKMANIEVVIINITNKNFCLLKELGVDKLFKFNNHKEPVSIKKERDDLPGCPEKKTDQEDMDDTILKAHKTLMEVDEKNVGKFQDVVEMVEKDINKRKQNKKK